MTKDRIDKPCKQSKIAKKLVGGAWQIRNFLKLLPIIIEDKIKDVFDPMWLAALQLSEICDIICSPVIHESNLPYLHVLISEYILSRQMLFPDIPL